MVINLISGCATYVNRLVQTKAGYARGLVQTKDGAEKLAIFGYRVTQNLGMALEGRGYLSAGLRFTRLSGMLDDLALAANLPNIFSDIEELTANNIGGLKGGVISGLFARAHQLTSIVADIAVPLLWVQNKGVYDLTGKKGELLDVVGKYVMLVFHSLKLAEMLSRKFIDGNTETPRYYIGNLALKVAANCAKCFASPRTAAVVGLASAAVDLYVYSSEKRLL